MPGDGLLPDPIADREYQWRKGVEDRLRAIQALPIMLWRAAYSASAYYGEGDVVTSGGATYVCILAHTAVAPPNATYWTAI